MARKKASNQPVVAARASFAGDEGAAAAVDAIELSFSGLGSERPTKVEFTSETIGELRKRMTARPQTREEAEGQGNLPEMPEPSPRRPLYSGTLTAKAERVGFGAPTRPHDLETDQGDVLLLYREKVTRTVEVIVEADSYDDAQERSQAKIDSLVGGLHQLFADYQGDPACPSWRVKKL